MGDRVTLREGDALTDDLGAAAFDLIVMCNMIHNFDREQNRQLVGKASVALRPGGVMAIVDLERPEPGRSGQTAALTNLYFSMINTSGTWTPSEVSGWQRDAGLEPCRPMALRRGPGIFIQNALKPAAPDAP
jgi:SAM-dependent methyltransferase